MWERKIGYPIFKSPDEFYKERGGVDSGECDFGVMWAFDGKRGWRVSVVHSTGDVYGYFPRTGEVVLIGRIKGVNGEKACVSRGCRAGCAYEIARRLFEGWADRCLAGESLTWFAERLETHQR